MNDNLSRVNILNRLFEKTPTFWKKIRNIGLAVGIVSGAIISVPASTGLSLPATLILIAKIGGIVSGTTVGLSSLTSKERP